MGLFDNIIGNGAEEVEPLGIEAISETSGSTSTGSSSGDNGSNPGGSGTGGGKSDDTSNSIIISNDSQDASKDEIPEIDIGGDMDFSLFGGSPVGENTISPIIDITASSTENMQSPVITQDTLNGTGTVIIPPTINTADIITSSNIAITSNGESQNQIIQGSNAPISIGEVVSSIPAIDIISLNNTSLVDEKSNNGLMGIIDNTQSVGLTEESPIILTTTESITDNTPISIDNSINGLIQDNIQSSSKNSINIGIQENINPINTNDSILIGSEINTISQIGNLGEITHSSTPHESLAEKISGFLKELQELKENDDALLKEKTAEIARLEAEKRELEMIQADRERLNKTIDLLSNIKNI